MIVVYVCPKDITHTMLICNQLSGKPYCMTCEGNVFMQCRTAVTGDVVFEALNQARSIDRARIRSLVEELRVPCGDSAETVLNEIIEAIGT